MSTPIGTIIAWYDDSIPEGWAVCDGLNGTPDLIGKFIYGAEKNTDIRTTGGSDTHRHSNAGTNDVSAHNHGGTFSVGQYSVSPGDGHNVRTGTNEQAAQSGHHHAGYITPQSVGAHSHAIGETGYSTTVPVHINRIFIKKISE